MKKRLLITAICALALGFAGSAWSYDAGMAESYARLFAPVKGATAGKNLQLMKPEAFLDKVKGKEALVLLDVRTPAETGVFGATLPGTLVIPVNEVFTPQNLDRIPIDKPVVVLCKSGTRAVAVGTALRHIGFGNVFILKGGFKGLNAYMGPKEANSPVKPKKSRQ